MSMKSNRGNERAGKISAIRRKSTAKRIAVAIGALISATIIGLVSVILIGRSGVAPIRDGQEFTNGAVQIKDGFTSSFIINAGSGKAVLIDAGQDSDAKAIKDALAARNLNPEDVIAILLTHGHNDHFGGVNAFPNAQVMAMSADVGLVEGTEARRSRLGTLIGAHSTGIIVDKILEDGQELALGQLQVQVFAVPGHTAGSAAFLVDGVLYLGDSADSETEGGLRPAFWFVSEDTELNKASLKSLEAELSNQSVYVKYITFSHSGALEGFTALETFSNTQ